MSQPETAILRPLYTYRGYGFERVPGAASVWILALVDDWLIGQTLDADVDASIPDIAKFIWEVLWVRYGEPFYAGKNGTPSPRDARPRPIDNVPWEIHAIKDETAYNAARESYLACQEK